MEKTTCHLEPITQDQIEALRAEGKIIIDLMMLTDFYIRTNRPGQTTLSTDEISGVVERFPPPKANRYEIVRTGIVGMPNQSVVYLFVKYYQVITPFVFG